MSVRRLAPKELQPDAFAFRGETEAWIDAEIAKYPPGRQASAVIPLLWRAQEEAGGWVPQAAIEAIAARLGMAKIRVLEVATFYTMFNLEPVGKYFVQMCGTTPCQLAGSDDVKRVLRDRIGPEHHVTADGLFSWLEVECLGACCNAPMVQINYDYYEDLTAASMTALLDDLAAGRPVKTGSQTGRASSEPVGERATLTEGSLYDGSVVGSWRQRFEDEKAKKAAAAAAPPAEPAKAAAPPAPPKSDPAPAKAAPAEPAVAAAGKADEAKVPSDSTPPAAVDRAGPQTPPQAASDPASAPASAQPASAPVGEDAKPVMIAAAREGKPDDLKLIWGVGPKLEQMLHGMGVFHFDQIAGWTQENLRWVDQNLGAFRGRAVRDDWIGQSRKLASGWRPEQGTGEKPVS